MVRKERLSMERRQQILSLAEQGYSLRKIAQCLKISRHTVKRYMVPHDSENEGGALSTLISEPAWVQTVDWEFLVSERKKGASYKALYDETKPGVCYEHFWKTLSTKIPEHIKTTVLLTHKPGENTFVDYCDGLTVVCSETGEVRKTQLFVGVLPFSQKTFAEFVWDQKLPSFIASHDRMWHFFGGVTSYTVPDNLKSAVTKAHIYNPDVNKTFCCYAQHMGFAVLPARPVRPRDKASVETGVGILQRTFFKIWRNHTFTSINELNAYLRAHILELNDKEMKDYGVSRNQRFEHEKKFLNPLPTESFEWCTWKIAKVHSDCHIQVNKALYSVPWTHVGSEVSVKITARIVEIFDRDTLLALCSHSTATRQGEHRTNYDHYPPEKREHLSFDMATGKRESATIGPETHRFVCFVFDQKHPLRYLRMVQGLVRLKTVFPKESLEYASKNAFQHRKYNLDYIKSCAQHHVQGAVLQPVSTTPQRLANTMLLHIKKG